MTCDKIKTIEGDNANACHVYPAGSYPALRFNENNVFIGCKHCNIWVHGSSHEYPELVRKKIGEYEWGKLMEIKDYYKEHTWKWDKEELIQIINKYKKLNEDYKSNSGEIHNS
jgi:hypothetical protein